MGGARQAALPAMVQDGGKKERGYGPIANDETKKEGKENAKVTPPSTPYSRATQSVLLETSSIELSMVQNSFSVGVLPDQLF